MRKIGIGYKILALSLLLVVGMGWLGYRAYQEYIKIITRHELVDLEDETNLAAVDLITAINGLEQDVLLLKGDYQIRELLRTYGTDKANPLFDRRVASRLKEFLRDNFNLDTPYVRANVVAGDGRELLRLDIEMDGKSWQQPPPDLTEAEWRERFTDKAAHIQAIETPAAGLSANETSKPYFQKAGESSARLRVEPMIEQFREQGSDLLTVRVAQPLYANDKVLGVVSVSMDLEPLTLRWQRHPRLLTFLTDDKGRFLVHPHFPAGSMVVRHGEPLRVGSYPATAPFGSLYRESASTTSTQAPDSMRLELDDTPRAFAAEFAHRMLIGQAHWKRTSAASETRQALERWLLKWAHADCRRRFDLSSWSSTQTSPRVVFAAPDAEALDVVERELARVSGPEFWVDIESRIAVDRFAVQFVKVYIDPANPESFLGYVRAVSYDEIEADVQNEVWNRLQVPVLILGGALLLTSVLGSWYITRPLVKMTGAAQQVARGNYEVRLPRRATGEIGELAEAFQGMIDDVHQRDKQLRDREARTRAIVDMAADGILTTDRRGTIETFNRAAEQILGYSAAEVIGKSFDTLLTEVWNLDAFKIDLEQTARWDELTKSMSKSPLETATIAGSDGGREFVGMRRDGSRFPMEASVSKVETDSRTVYIVIVRDITERKRAKEELERRVQQRTQELQQAKEDLELAQQAREQFLASVSHELRTPLTPVLGFTEELLDTTLTEEQRSCARHIYTQSKRLLRLINDILDYQKIVMGRLSIEVREFDLERLMDDAIKSVEPIATKNRDRLTKKIAKDFPTLSTDDGRVLQILCNLLSNACKFTKDGEVTVSAEHQQHDGREWVVLRISDTGSGLSPQQQAKLFKPFTKLLSRTDNPEGTGLGLAICQGICQALGGDIVVESTAGKGSTFSARILAHLGDQVTAPTTAARPAPPLVAEVRGNGTPENKTVLVVDDESEVRELMCRFLERRGFRVISADNGAEGIELAKKHKPALITLDAVMPGLDGWGTLAALKNDSETAEIPVIMVTMLDSQSRGFALGAADYLVKPIDWQHLARVSRRLLGESREGTILVVDDDIATREHAARILKADGWEITSASNGREALEILKDTTPRLILLDLLMPEMDGFEFVEVVRSHPEWRKLPIVVITAKDLNWEDRERIRGGVTQIIEKGDLNWERLRLEIEAVIGKSIAAMPDGSVAVK